MRIYELRITIGDLRFSYCPPHGAIMAIDEMPSDEALAAKENRKSQIANLKF